MSGRAPELSRLTDPRKTKSSAPSTKLPVRPSSRLRTPIRSRSGGHECNKSAVYPKVPRGWRQLDTSTLWICLVGDSGTSLQTMARPVQRQTLCPTHPQVWPETSTKHLCARRHQSRYRLAEGAWNRFHPRSCSSRVRHPLREANLLVAARRGADPKRSVCEESVEKKKNASLARRTLLVL